MRHPFRRDRVKGGTRGAPIMPRDAVSRTANVGTMGKNGHKKLFRETRPSCQHDTILFKDDSKRQK